MAPADIAFASVEIWRKLIAPATFLVLPVILVLWSRHSARTQTAEEEKKAVWLGFVRLSRFVIALTLVGWWATWDLNCLSDLLPPLVPWLSGSLEPSSVQTLLLWIPPIVSLGAFLVLSYATSALLLELKWTLTDVLKLVCWRLMNFVVPLLMIATGFDDILRGDLWGSAWIAAAGGVALVGTICLHHAEGMKLHIVRASETRNRALVMARRLGSISRGFTLYPPEEGI